MEKIRTVKIWIGSIPQQELFYDYIINIITEEGTYLHSDFQKDWGFKELDPDLWECLWKPRDKPVRVLLKNVSYWDSFEEQVDSNLQANCAILIYHPIKKMRIGVSSMMKFIGEYQYSTLNTGERTNKIKQLNRLRQKRR